jgi:hypothetical protein
MAGDDIVGGRRERFGTMGHELHHAIDQAQGVKRFVPGEAKWVSIDEGALGRAKGSTADPARATFASAMGEKMYRGIAAQRGGGKNPTTLHKMVDPVDLKARVMAAPGLEGFRKGLIASDYSSAAWSAAHVTEAVRGDANRFLKQNGVIPNRVAKGTSFEVRHPYAGAKQSIHVDPETGKSPSNWKGVHHKDGSVTIGGQKYKDYAEFQKKGPGALSRQVAGRTMNSIYMDELNTYSSERKLKATQGFGGTARNWMGAIGMGIGEKWDGFQRDRKVKARAKRWHQKREGKQPSWFEKFSRRREARKIKKARAKRAARATKAHATGTGTSYDDIMYRDRKPPTASTPEKKKASFMDKWRKTFSKFYGDKRNFTPTGKEPRPTGSHGKYKKETVFDTLKRGLKSGWTGETGGDMKRHLVAHFDKMSDSQLAKRLGPHPTGGKWNMDKIRGMLKNQLFTNQYTTKLQSLRKQQQAKPYTDKAQIKKMLKLRRQFAKNPDFGFQNILRGKGGIQFGRMGQSSTAVNQISEAFESARKNAGMQTTQKQTAQFRLQMMKEAMGAAKGAKGTPEMQHRRRGASKEFNREYKRIQRSIKKGLPVPQSQHDNLQKLFDRGMGTVKAGDRRAIFNRLTSTGTGQSAAVMGMTRSMEAHVVKNQAHPSQQMPNVNEQNAARQHVDDQSRYLKRVEKLVLQTEADAASKGGAKPGRIEKLGKLLGRVGQQLGGSRFGSITERSQIFRAGRWLKNTGAGQAVGNVWQRGSQGIGTFMPGTAQKYSMMKANFGFKSPGSGLMGIGKQGLMSAKMLAAGMGARALGSWMKRKGQDTGSEWMEKWGDTISTHGGMAFATAAVVRGSLKDTATHAVAGALDKTVVGALGDAGGMVVDKGAKTTISKLASGIAKGGVAKQMAKGLGTNAARSTLKSLMPSVGMSSQKGLTHKLGYLIGRYVPGMGGKAVQSMAGKQAGGSLARQAGKAIPGALARPGAFSSIKTLGLTMGAHILAAKAISSSYVPKFEQLGKAYSAGDASAGVELTAMQSQMETQMLRARMGIDLAATAALTLSMGAAAAPGTGGWSMAGAVVVAGLLTGMDMMGSSQRIGANRARGAGMRFGKEMENFGIHSQAQQEEIFEQMQKGMMGTPGYDNPFGMNVNYDMEQAMNSKQVEDARDAIGLLMSGETQSLSNDGEYEAAANRAAAITDKERDAIQYQIDRQEEVGKEGENWGGWKAWKSRFGQYFGEGSKDFAELGLQAKRQLENEKTLKKRFGLDFDNLKVDDEGNISFAGQDSGGRFASGTAAGANSSGSWNYNTASGIMSDPNIMNLLSDEQKEGIENLGHIESAKTDDRAARVLWQKKKNAAELATGEGREWMGFSTSNMEAAQEESNIASGAAFNARKNLSRLLEKDDYAKPLHDMYSARTPEERKSAADRLQAAGYPRTAVMKIQEKMVQGKGMTPQQKSNQRLLRGQALSKQLVNAQTGKQITGGQQMFIDPRDGKRYVYEGNKKTEVLSKGSYFTRLITTGQIKKVTDPKKNKEGEMVDVTKWVDKDGNVLSTIDPTKEDQEHWFAQASQKLFGEGGASIAMGQRDLSDMQDKIARKGQYAGYAGRFRMGYLSQSGSMDDFEATSDAGMTKLRAQLYGIPKGSSTHKNLTRELHKLQSKRFVFNLEKKALEITNTNDPAKKKALQKELANMTLLYDSLASRQGIKTPSGKDFSSANINELGMELFGDAQFNSATADLINKEVVAAMEAEGGADFSGLRGDQKKMAMLYLQNRIRSGDLSDEQRGKFENTIGSLTTAAAGDIGTKTTEFRNIIMQRRALQRQLEAAHGPSPSAIRNGDPAGFAELQRLKGLQDNAAAGANQALQVAAVGGAVRHGNIATDIMVPNIGTDGKPMAFDASGKPEASVSLADKYGIPTSMRGKGANRATAAALSLEGIHHSIDALTAGGGTLNARDKRELEKLQAAYVRTRNALGVHVNTERERVRKEIEKDPDKGMALRLLNQETKATTASAAAQAAGGDAAAGRAAAMGATDKILTGDLPANVRVAATTVLSGAATPEEVALAKAEVHQFISNRQSVRLRDELMVASNEGGSVGAVTSTTDKGKELSGAAATFAGDYGGAAKDKSDHAGASLPGKPGTPSSDDRKKAMADLVRHFLKQGMDPKTYLDTIAGRRDTGGGTGDERISFGNDADRQAWLNDMSSVLSAAATTQLAHQQDGSLPAVGSIDWDKEMQARKLSREARRKRQHTAGGTDSTQSSIGGPNLVQLPDGTFFDPNKPGAKPTKMKHKKQPGTGQTMFQAGDIGSQSGGGEDDFFLPMQVTKGSDGKINLPAGSSVRLRYVAKRGGYVRIDPVTGDPVEGGNLINEDQFYMMAQSAMKNLGMLQEAYKTSGGGLNMNMAQLQALASLESAREMMEEEEKRRRMFNKPGGNFAQGFVPNFAAKPNFAAGPKKSLYRGRSTNFTKELYAAKTREIQALVNRGYDQSSAERSVYVAEHPAITSNNARLSDVGNIPNFGVGVFNRIDEPLGPSQGIHRARREGESINTYGTKVPTFHAGIDAARAPVVPNFEAQQAQLDTAVGAFGEIAKAAESMSNSMNKADGVKQVQSISSSENTSNANVNVNVRGSIEAVPNAIAQAVIDWSRRNAIKGGGYFPPQRRS